MLAVPRTWRLWVNKPSVACTTALWSYPYILTTSQHLRVNVSETFKRKSNVTILELRHMVTNPIIRILAVEKLKLNLRHIIIPMDYDAAVGGYQFHELKLASCFRGDEYGVSSVCFDPQEDLLWAATYEVNTKHIMHESSKVIPHNCCPVQHPNPANCQFRCFQPV